MTRVVYSVKHLSAKQERKTPLEFLRLPLGCFCVWPRRISQEGIWAEEVFGSVAFPQPVFNTAALPQPSAPISRQQLSGSVSGWSLFRLSKGFLCLLLQTRVSTENCTSYFLTEHLSSLVVCPVSLQEENKWPCVCSTLPQTWSCLKQNFLV